MSQIVIHIPDERPMSWNVFYSGRHWSVRHKEAQRVHQLVRAYIDPDLDAFDVPVHILTVVGFPASNPLDADNICDKLYIDGLRPWVIPDDHPGIVKSVTRIGQESDLPYVNLVISPHKTW